MSIEIETHRNVVAPEVSVRERYSKGARQREESLCCPVAYDRHLLEIIPDEILERDYGCGDPSRYVRPGDTVLDLGSGGGKLCYIAAQLVGRDGKVIGVDCNAEMLSLARRHQPTVAKRLGFDNVSFRSGMIQDLRLDLDLLEKHLAHHPVASRAGWLELRAVEDRLRAEHPMIAESSVDCVLSNCVLNLVRHGDREQLFGEVFRVLRRDGRAVISDIVCDEEVPAHLQRDPELWSGCISGAFREDRFLEAFEQAGFHGLEIVERQAEPWRVVEGIEFRSMTVMAHKGKLGPCLERKQGLIYRGPFSRVEDDDGHVFHRGRRTAVCDKTFHLLQREPYEELFEPIEPADVVPLDEALPFDCKRGALRDPSETRTGMVSTSREETGDCCGPACC
ncbi:arsenite S-adenosylmethyltransferase [Planctomycetes bacterium Pan216]|uniref:Arsenite methyltransferase n=1 Tax=Kolteria novifilia TaxID=2527975 RepID=A0A518B496_9BACT|nr:arsenite S-adenosylmethyltransferase [Planctomycetes bacterium Pan216]